MLIIISWSILDEFIWSLSTSHIYKHCRDCIKFGTKTVLLILESFGLIEKAHHHHHHHLIIQRRWCHHHRRIPLRLLHHDGVHVASNPPQLHHLFVTVATFNKTHHHHHHHCHLHLHLHLHLHNHRHRHRHHHRLS